MSKPKLVRIHLRTEISYEEVRFEDVAETDAFAPDPYTVLRAKIEALASILDCTEEEAQRVLFERM